MSVIRSISDEEAKRQTKALYEYLASQESQSVKSPDHFRFQVLDRLHKPRDMDGYRLPWESCHERLNLRVREVSIWAAINGHYKSTLLNMIGLWCAMQTKVGFMSFEMEPDELIELMVKQAAGTRNPPPRYGNDFINWADGRIWLYDRIDSTPMDNVLGCLYHMTRNLGIKLIIVDSLMMIRGITRDAERESKFMSTLTATAKALDCHIALVHHIRKPERGDESYIPTRFDVRGAGDLVDMAQVCVVPWANKRKFELEQIGIKDSSECENVRDQRLFDMPDQLLAVRKQRRGGGFEGKIALRRPGRGQTFSDKPHALQLNIPRWEEMEVPDGEEAV